MSTKQISPEHQEYIEVTAADLPLYCPTPDMKLWNTHPRVAIQPASRRGFHSSSTRRAG